MKIPWKDPPRIKLIVFSLMLGLGACASDPQEPVDAIDQTDQGEQDETDEPNIGNTNPFANPNPIDTPNPNLGAIGGAISSTLSGGAATIPQGQTEGGGVIAGAAGLPAAPGLPELGSKLPYIIKKGDTLAKIAKLIYGDHRRWREMAEISNLPNPHLIYAGEVVYYQLVPEAVAFAASYENMPREEITVAAGETLRSISHRVYGTESQWKNIWRNNDTIESPNNLNVGQVVYFVSPEARLNSVMNGNDLPLPADVPVRSSLQEDAGLTASHGWPPRPAQGGNLTLDAIVSA